MSFHRLLVWVALAGGIAGAAPFAVAREPSRAAPTTIAVESVDVEQVAELGAGVPLRFTVFGTPGALVALRIDGARRGLELRETEPGVYEGSYVIDGRDAIGAGSRVTATLQRDGAVAHSTLDEPLLLARGPVPWGSAAAAPEPAPSAMPRPIPVSPPEPGPPAAFAAAPQRERERDLCADCAVVESVRAVEAPPGGGVIGAVGGAIAGAILGKEAGAAHNRRMLTLLGAIGGAFTGRAIERRATQSMHYDVELRLADGTVLKRRYEQAPPFASGETIRLGVPAGRGTPVPASF